MVASLKTILWRTWKPMQISKNGSDMIVYPCVHDKSSSRFLDILQLSNVSGAVERNKIDREPRHDLSSWAGCQESRPSPTQMWRTIPCPAAVSISLMSTFDSCWRVPIQISWVLSILSMFDCIQPSISSMHSVYCRAATDDLEAGTLRCTCASSAYECATSPFLLMNSSSSAVYSRKRKGPRTEPCGTP